MIELFNLIKKQREKSIKIKCDKVSYWRSESEKVNDFIEYVKTNINKFCIDKMEVVYDESAMNEIYVRSFDLILWTDKETYDYLNNDYDFLFEKYDRYTINLDDFKFYTLSDNDFSRLRIH